MHTGPRPLMDPIVLLESILDKPEKEVKDVCKDVARELSREQIYQRFLERFFGFREYADRTIDGGLIGKRKLMADTRVPGLIKQDTRVMILTSDPKYSWNLYWILLNTRDTREADVNEMMLPQRTRMYLEDKLQDFDLLSTDNRKLYEQLLPNSSRARAMMLPKGPLKVAVLDHYHFTFFYWAVIDKKADSPEMLTSLKYGNMNRAKFDYEKLISEGKLGIKSITGRAVYFELVEAYIKTYFPRDTDTGNSATLDAEQALRMPFESEKFLRILIEMWLERNSVQNPDLKQQQRGTDEENDGADYYVPPHADALHGCILVVAHLLSRKVHVDLLCQTSRVARPVHICPALEALSQPLFVLLANAFRSLKVASNSTELFLCVDLWLTWLQPSQVFKKAGAPSAVAERSSAWREMMLRSYVASNFHFYTTLLVLFMRRIRETLGAGWGRHEITLNLLQRVLGVYQVPEVMAAVAEVSRQAEQLWKHGNVPMRGYEYLLRHIRHMRLSRSRPVLTSFDACPDANFLCDELRAVRDRATRNLLEGRQQNVVSKWAGKILLAAQQWFSGDSLTDPPGGDWDEDFNVVIKRVDDVLKVLGEVFPRTRASAQVPSRQPGQQFKDADRQGILLTPMGRRQVLSGLRACDPKTAAAAIDPLYNPELGDWEVGLLVSLAQWLYSRIQWMFDPDYEPPATGDAYRAAALAVNHKGGHLDMRSVKVNPHPRVNIRPWVADLRYYLLYVMLLLGWRAIIGSVRLVWYMWTYEDLDLPPPPPPRVTRVGVI